MSELVAVPEKEPESAAAIVALDGQAPRLEDLFGFMAQAELRVRSLRMRIVERIWNARSESASTIDVLLRHPGRARVTTRASLDPLSRDYRIWSSDGSVITTYDAMNERASIRPVRPRVAGATRDDLPRFAQVHVPLTQLPHDSIVDTLVHPHGFIRNVLLTGPVTLTGSAILAGRECLMLRSDHPRATLVLTDRPDRWLEVGVDRQTGFILLLVERIGELVTRHVETVGIEFDPPVPDEAFTVHLPSDVRRIY